jgi:Protein of unknown function with PCYCGC motif
MTKSKKEPQKPQPSKKPSLGIIFLIIILGGIAVFALTRNKQYEPPAPTPTPTQAQKSPEPESSPQAYQQQPAQPDASSDVDAQFHVPTFFENPDMAEPLKPVLDPATVPYFAREGYESVKRKPKLMTQMPCFCYCEKFGHQSLHTCFETDHAVHCDICLKEALEADRMDSQGLSPQEIRQFIIQTYKPSGEHNHS